MNGPDATHTFDLALKILGVLGWVGTAIMAVWIMSRRSQGWDRGNQAWLQLNGDKESKVDGEKVGLIDQHTQTRNVATEALDRTKAVQEGLGAYGSRSDIIAQGVRRSISALTTEELQRREEAAIRRKQLVAYQHQAFGPARDDNSFVENVEDPPFRPDDTQSGRKKR